MIRLILELIALVIVLGGAILLVSYLTYFWINARRKWKKEDEAFNEKKKQEAIADLIDSHNLLVDTKEGYINKEDYTKRESELLGRL